MAMRRDAGAAIAVAIALAAADGAGAAEFRGTSDASVMYDAPSSKARPMFVYGRDTPLEVVVALEGWTKVRDAAGTIGWVEQKSLAERRTLVVVAKEAEARAEASETSSVVFAAAEGVLLELAEPAASANATATPGWVKVRHRDGAAGFVRIAQVFGL